MKDFLVGLPIALALAALVWAAVVWDFVAYCFVGTIAVLGFTMIAVQAGSAIRNWRGPAEGSETR